jgi:hypothetical protein
MGFSSYKDFQEYSDQFADLNSDFYLSNPPWSASSANGFYRFQYPYEMAPHEDLGFTQATSSEVRHIYRTKDKIIYDAIYHFDEKGRRLAPIENRNRRKKFIVLSGCSFTYGNGLNDNQTLNYFLSKELNDFMPYNYAIGGTGTNTTLALIESNRLAQEVSEKMAFLFIFILMLT